MDEKIEETFDLLYDNITWLYTKWQIYKQLFGSSEQNIKLLNEFAPICFRIYQDVLLDDVILTINRLLETPIIQNNHNVTLLRMIDLLKKYNQNVFSEKLNNRLENLQSLKLKLKKIRDKRIGHNDLNSAKSNFDNIPGISRNEIDHILNEICDFINDVSDNLYKKTILFIPDLLSRSDGENFILYLNKLKKYIEKEDPL